MPEEKKLLSPCCDARIDMSLGDGVPIGSCSKCSNYVVRVNPKTNVEEWLDGNSPWTPDTLRPVVRENA